jgi:predicted nucleic acid-binding protein
MILLDTSVLIEAATGAESSLIPARMRLFIANAERIVVPSLVFYEFLRGPRRPEELAFQEALFPVGQALPYGAVEAQMSAALYKSLSRARGRELDLAIAACAIVHDAALWTLNVKDFSNIPGLRMVPSTLT